MSSPDLSYILNELGEDHSLHYGAVSPPIYQTTNFCFRDVAHMREALQHESSIPFYTRGTNPTIDVVRKKLAALEGAEDALLFASGSAAVAAAVMVHLRAGDHVVCVQKPYSWSNKLLNVMLARFGVTTTMIDGTRPEAFAEALQPATKLIFLESPNSTTYELQDLAAVAKLARARGIVTVIDNSTASPLGQQPIALGIDLVVHSATKYIGGHSDAIAGVVCGTHAMMERIFASEFMTLGGVLSPFNAWLLLRGLRTLPLRYERSCRTAERLVAFLETHPGVERVYYPFSETHPQHELARQQMTWAGGQFSVLLRTQAWDAVERFCNTLKRFLLGCSWGGHESLAFPMCTLYDSANYQAVLPFNLVRFYAGLEEPEVLIEDLRRALAAMDAVPQPAKPH
ncbi:Cystathionine beta-lyase/cystathionine gamma-synthase [Catalinimonas alkaloidigena]|uniref:Cystathionine beta-lyase/cystathionine gamma-synthase n=1 Tax=Catalinimonas alkaloidigena TaxID=1075417 RepID=A0A1G9HJ78_9BACT|nr:aminotransferase class I/II-fold pyridoxal phosphate-dependent enzyme [Catalinimonas alkaloidigena]SDL12563.1 Cystathionine beta-lyase/cystathionine gamma-synthase [Catalinimonas alkaloidigena]